MSISPSAAPASLMGVLESKFPKESIHVLLELSISAPGRCPRLITNKCLPVELTELPSFYLFVYVITLVSTSQGYSSGGAGPPHCSGLPVVILRLWSTGSEPAAHRLSYSEACGVFPDQGSNLCPLHWQVDSYPLRHQGSPM